MSGTVQKFKTYKNVFASKDPHFLIFKQNLDQYSFSLLNVFQSFSLNLRFFKLDFCPIPEGCFFFVCLFPMIIFHIFWSQVVGQQLKQGGLDVSSPYLLF